MPRPRYTPPSDEVAAEIAQLVDMYRQLADLEERCKALLAFLADRENGRGVTITYLAERLGEERKTIYRRLGRSMT